MKILGVIPARGGSKGLAHKNILPFVGKPLIVWTIEEALKVSEINRLICSTDDEKIAKIASSHGCEVPFIRPKELAEDLVPTIDVLLHAVDFFEKNGDFFDAVVCLQCTSPLRTNVDIRQAIRKYIQESAKSLVSVCEAEHFFSRLYTINSEGRLETSIENSFSFAPRQNLPKLYRANGAIYINDIQTTKKTGNLFEPPPIAFIMDRTRSVDIDDENDFMYAEFLFSKILGRCRT